MTERRYEGEFGAHSAIKSGEACLIYILGLASYPNGYGDGIDKDRKIAKEVNSIWKNNRTGRDIRSLLMHIEHCNLHVEDFCD